MPIGFRHKAKNIGMATAVALFTFSLYNPITESFAQNKLPTVVQTDQKSNAGLLQSVPEEYRGSVKIGLEELDRMGATYEQKQIYVQGFNALSGKIILRGRSTCANAVFDPLFRNPSFKPAMLNEELAKDIVEAAEFIVENNTKWDDAVSAFAALLKNPHFKPDMFNREFAENFTECASLFVTEIDKKSTRSIWFAMLWNPYLSA